MKKLWGEISDRDQRSALMLALGLVLIIGYGVWLIFFMLFDSEEWASITTAIVAIGFILYICW